MSKSARPVRPVRPPESSASSVAESSPVEEVRAAVSPPEKPVQPAPPIKHEPPKPELFDNPVYSAYVSKTVQDAAESYRIARILSFVLFAAGMVLLIVSLFFGIVTSDTTQTVVFGILGTVILVALLLYRPIERIQAGAETLLRSQFAALAFSVQSDIAMRGLKAKDTESQLRAAQALQDATAQFIANLDSATPKQSVPKAQK